MTISPLAASLAEQIREHIREQGFAVGERVVERKLADMLKVSRTPIRNALKTLENSGVLASSSAGGYVVANVEAHSSSKIAFGVRDEQEDVYLQIAAERLQGVLPTRITENELSRRFDLTKSKLNSVLRRMVKEGWIERLPGHGWEFLPVLTSLDAYEDSYRFRLLIEPAALLEPRWKLDRASLTKRREEQLWLVNGGIREVSAAELFEMNSGMHEALIECSDNSFLIDALKRVDRVRRLIDYRQALDRESAAGRCREHVAILELAMSGKNDEASLLMRRHLGELSTTKTVPPELRSIPSDAAVGPSGSN